ncbi:prepilin peptidase [uncultured Rubinisphaera sp.]|uniref:prepilin peptidase n=1 Tax=uncultured Rubinisphaera sp. TaxID=1678686 RepID=UPI0030DCA53D
MLPVSYLITCVFLFIVGLFLGRFLNRCIHRLPDEFYVFPAWKKVFCQEKRLGQYPQTRWYHILPVIGTSQIVGRSPYSGRRIRKREPWLELLNGFLVVLTFLCIIPPEQWGGAEHATVVSSYWAKPIFDWKTLSPLFVWGRFLYFLFLVETLFVATFIDFDLWIIPDGSTFPAMIVGFVGQFLGVGFFLVPIWLQDPSMVEFSQQLFPMLSGWPVTGIMPQWVHYNHHWHALAVSTAGFIVGGGIVWAVRIIGHFVLRREAMGFGDVILMAMIGSFIGWQPVVVVFFLAPVMALCVIAVVTILRSLSLANFPTELPYGPYLSLATLVVLFGWNIIWPGLIRIFAVGPLLIAFALLMLVFLVITLWLLQLLKRLIGIPVWEEEIGGWRSADQLHFHMSSKIDSQSDHWPQKRWSGLSASRGKIHEQNWRGPCR